MEEYENEDGQQDEKRTNVIQSRGSTSRRALRRGRTHRPESPSRSDPSPSSATPHSPCTIPVPPSPPPRAAPQDTRFRNLEILVREEVMNTPIHSVLTQSGEVEITSDSGHICRGEGGAPAARVVDVSDSEEIQGLVLGATEIEEYDVVIETPSSPSESLGSTSLMGSDIMLGELGKIISGLNERTPYCRKFGKLIELSLSENWFASNYAKLVEDSLIFTKCYFHDVSRAIRFNSGPTFWDRHVGAHVTTMSIEQCVVSLFHDYPDDFRAMGISRAWLGFCLSTFLDVTDGYLTREQYENLIIDPALDSQDTFLMNVKQLVMLAVLATEFVRPGQEVRRELFLLLELTPHAAVILDYLSHSKTTAIRMSAVNALSSINFDENHTYRTLYNASVDPDCRVRVQFCKATPEFMIKSMFDVDYLGEEVAVQLTVMKNKVCFSGEYKREELIERLRDLWRTDPVQEVGTEAQLALVQLGVFRVYSSDV